MISEEKRALIAYRMEQAAEALSDATALLERGSCRATLNRAYYSMFYAVLALLNLHGEETSKHHGAISHFDRDFVKTGVFTKDFSKWLHEIFLLRQKSDYDALVTISLDEAREALERAGRFVESVKAHLTKQT